MNTILIGKETFILAENDRGYEIRETKSNSIHESCNYGELNEAIYRMIDRICGK